MGLAPLWPSAGIKIHFAHFIHASSKSFLARQTLAIHKAWLMSAHNLPLLSYLAVCLLKNNLLVFYTKIHRQVSCGLRLESFERCIGLWKTCKLNARKLQQGLEQGWTSLKRISDN